MNANAIHVLPSGAYQTNTYLVCPEGRTDAFFIDPGDDFQRLHEALAASGRTLSAILLTHGHFDHMLGAEPLQRETGAMVYVSEKDAEMLFDAVKNAFDPKVSRLPLPTLMDYDVFEEHIEVCGVNLKVIPTPGHTRGSVCFYNEESAILFSGDTMFHAGYGRTDLYGGDMFAMARSLKTLLALPENVRVFTGHGDATTIGDERRRYRH